MSDKAIIVIDCDEETVNVKTEEGDRHLVMLER